MDDVGDVDTAAVVLCGGTSRRMGGVDKTAEPLAGSTVLDHLLDALPRAWPVVCVGAQRPTHRAVAWTRESPPGGGPVAGTASALAHLPAVTGGTVPSVVVLLAGDMPFAGPVAVEVARRLRELPEGVDAVLGSDGEGRTQPLLAAYRFMALAAALPAEPAGTPVMALVSALATQTLTVSARSALDVDTPAALARARHMVGS